MPNEIGMPENPKSHDYWELFQLSLNAWLRMLGVSPDKENLKSFIPCAALCEPRGKGRENFGKRGIPLFIGFMYLRDEGFEPVTNCHQLKLQAEDGKRHKEMTQMETESDEMQVYKVQLVTNCYQLKMRAEDGKMLPRQR